MSEAVLDQPSFSVPAAIFGEDGFASLASPALEQAQPAGGGRPVALRRQRFPPGGLGAVLAWRGGDRRSPYRRGAQVCRPCAGNQTRGLDDRPVVVAQSRFVKGLEAKDGKDEVILLLCRSGKRSAAAAEAATKAGFKQVFNILEGFEGDLDEQQRRGAFNGWRHAGLAWVQE